MVGSSGATSRLEIALISASVSDHPKTSRSESMWAGLAVAAVIVKPSYKIHRRTACAEERLPWAAPAALVTGLERTAPACSPPKGL